jgi:hypothetical protein
LAKIVLLYTLPKAYEHLRHDVESSQDSTYSKAKETIRSFEKSSVFAASLAEHVDLGVKVFYYLGLWLWYQ